MILLTIYINIWYTRLLQALAWLKMLNMQDTVRNVKINAKILFQQMWKLLVQIFKRNDSFYGIFFSGRSRIRVCRADKNGKLSLSPFLSRSTTSTTLIAKPAGSAWINMTREEREKEGMNFHLHGRFFEPLSNIHSVRSMFHGLFPLLRYIQTTLFLFCLLYLLRRRKFGWII